MPQNTNLNRSPYYDDFDAGKNFYRLLFRPGYSIQARELTQLQSMLQDQVEQVGNSMFKQGQMVIPGEVSYSDTYEYVKLSSISQVAQNVNGELNFVKYDIQQLVGKTLVGQTSGVKAFVDNYAYETSTDADTIFVKYVSSGADNIDTKFRQGESLKLEDATTDNDPTLVVGSDGIKPASSPAMGMGSAVNVQKGIYFINGHFVQNQEQTLILSKYSTESSFKVGWTISETIVTPEDDASLKDNAQGYSNYSAPGAHRLKITLNLEKFDINTPSNKNFVQLVYLQQGKIQRQIKQTAPSQIEEILARRTYDESGDYIVKTFLADLKEYYNSGGTGFYKVGTDGTVNGLTPEQAAEKLVLSVGPGKAYVRGYEVESTETKYLELDKARTTEKRDNTRLYASPLPQLGLRGVMSSVPISATADGESTPFKKLDLYKKFCDSYLGTNGLKNSEEDGVFVTQDLRGSTYGIDEAVMTVWVYAGVTPVNGDAVDVSGTADITLASLKAGNKKELFHYNGTTYVGVNVVAARYNVNLVMDGGRPVIAWQDEGGSGGMNENSGGNPTHVVQELVLRGPISALYSIHTSYQSLGPTLLGSTGGGATNGISLYGNNSGSVYYGMILDYTMPMTPIVGRAIARDFKFAKLPTGFDKTKSVIASVSQQNTTFTVGYTNPILFSRIKLTGNHAFNTGSNIQGSISGATAVVEGGLSVGQNDPENATLSHGNIITVSNVIGEFEEGEEIFDMDDSNKSAVIAISGRISHFVVPYGGENYSENLELKISDRQYQSNYINVTRETASGAGINAQDNYIRNIRFTELGRREVLDKFEVPPELEVVDEGGVHSAGDADAYARAVLYTNVITTFGSEDIRSVGMDHGASSKKFSGDIQYAETDYTEFSTLSNGLTYSGRTDADYIEATNFTARPADEVKEDDLIQLTINGKTFRYEVARACNASTDRAGRIYLKQRLILGFLSNTVTRVRAKIENTGKSTLVLPLPNAKIASAISDQDDDSGITYYSRKQFIESVTVDGTTNEISIAAQLDFGQQQFTNFNNQDYILEIYTVGATTTRYGSATGDIVRDGDIIYLDDEMVTVSSGSSTNVAGSITIKLPAGFFHQSGSLNLSDMKLKLSATVETSKAKPKLKTIVRNNRISIASDLDNEIIPIRGDNYDNPTGTVNSFSDVFKLRYVYEGTPGVAPTVNENGEILGGSGTDITDFFLFDDGQRDSLYDTAALVRKPGYRTPTGTLVIGFDYFKHSEGDFFTVDSYLHENGVTYDEIPTFTSLVHGRQSLSDVIDFRPLVGTSAQIPGYLNASVMDANSNVSEVFTTGGVTAALPADTESSNNPYTFACRYDYFVDRIDTIYLKKDGQFIVKKGAGSNDPQSAESIDEAIKVFKIYVPAFTDSVKKVKVFPVENKRFTMRDISKLEKKIERLERYTMLSVLEQTAMNTQIKDAVTGVDLFKSGFAVDNFENYALSNINSVDYKCSLDMTRGTLRPESKETAISLVEKDSSVTSRLLSNYVVNHGMVTLPFTEAVLCQNIFATSTVSVNPFLVFRYRGTADITPNVDPWYDEYAMPALNNNDNQTLDPLEVYDDGDTALAQIHDVSKIALLGNETEFSNVASLSSDAPDLSLAEVVGSKSASSSNIAAQNSEIPLQQSATTIGEKVISTSLVLYIKEQYIEFHLRRMKPNTRIYPFIDGIALADYLVPDRNYSGQPGSSLRNWGDNLITDDSGSATGILLMPGGRKPTKGTSYEDDINTLTFDAGEGLRFPMGDKKIKFTSSSTNADDAETFATITFRAKAIKDTAPNDIISVEEIDSEDHNDGTQYTENVLNPDVSVVDPMAQTFRVESFDGGVFASSVDLYFSQKDASLPVTVKMVDTIAGRPSKNVIPGSTVVMDPNTYIRVITSGSHSLIKGEIIEGDTSNAQGPLLGVLDSQNQPVPAVNNTFTLATTQVYTLILSDHNKEDFIPGEPLVVTSLTVANNARSGDDIVKMEIVLDSGYVSHIVMNDLGDGYAGSTTVTVESPQLPGGVTSTATPSITDQKVYEIAATLGGSEYTTPPSVLIVSNSATELANATAVVKYNKPAVRMGVATDAKALVPTKFVFQYPVYLENDREYALVVETNSTQYQTFISRLGETEINSNSTVTTQPLLGSLFKSQNSNLWTANQYEDLKFDMHRAQFDTTKSGVLELVNGDMGYENLQSNPVETSTAGSGTTTSQLFGANQKIIKINHKNHGLSKGSFVAMKDVTSVGGYSTASLNNQILPVIDAGIDFYTVGMATVAGGSAIGGGYAGRALGQVKYEKALFKIDTIDYPETTLETDVTTALIKPIDSRENVTDYTAADPLRVIPNKEFFFPTQRVVASKLNEKLFAQRMGNQKSLKLAATLKTTNPNLSPIISLKNPKAVLTTNRVEAPTGNEERYGKKVQQVEFYKTVILRFSDSAGTPATLGSAQSFQTTDGMGQIITGKTSGTKGVLSYWDASSPGEMYVRIIEGDGFLLGEEPVFSGSSSYNQEWNFDGVTTNPSSGAAAGFTLPLKLTGNMALAQFDIDPAEGIAKQDNTKTGSVTRWNQENYRLIFTSNDASFVKGDLVGAVNTGTLQYDNGFDVVNETFNVPMEIKNVYDSAGYLFTPERLKNSSNVANYVTKEITLENPGNGITVKMTAALQEIDDVTVMFKTKRASQQIFFNEINWSYFNEDGNPDEDVAPSTGTNSSPTTESEADFKEYSFTVGGLKDFNSFAIKVVMKSRNPAMPPRIRDIRAIATY